MLQVQKCWLRVASSKFFNFFLGSMGEFTAICHGFSRKALEPPPPKILLRHCSRDILIAIGSKLGSTGVLNISLAKFGSGELVSQARRISFGVFTSSSVCRTSNEVTIVGVWRGGYHLKCRRGICTYLLCDGFTDYSSGRMNGNAAVAMVTYSENLNDFFG